jgi:hypothetical protein
MKVIVWGSFWDLGRTSLYIIDRDFESKKHRYSAASYLEVLEAIIGPMFEDLDKGYQFMQNNTSIHTAHKVIAWFLDQAIFCLRISLLSLRILTRLSTFGGCLRKESLTCSLKLQRTGASQRMQGRGWKVPSRQLGIFWIRSPLIFYIKAYRIGLRPASRQMGGTLNIEVRFWAIVIIF